MSDLYLKPGAIIPYPEAPWEIRTTQATCDLKWVNGELQQRYIITVSRHGKTVNSWSEWHPVPTETTPTPSE